MEPTSTRLVLEAAVVAVAIGLLGAGGLYAYVMARQQEPSALAVMNQTMGEMAARMAGYERDRARDNLTMLHMQMELELQKAYSRALAEYSKAQAEYSAMLAERLRALGQDVPPAPGNPPTPPLETAEARAVAIDDRGLALILTSLFSLEEIDDLALRLGIGAEEIGGETRGKRARSLVDYARRHGRSDDLLALARALRPDGKFT